MKLNKHHRALKIFVVIGNEVGHIIEFIKQWATFIAVIQAVIWPFVLLSVMTDDTEYQKYLELKEHISYEFDVNGIGVKSGIDLNGDKLDLIIEEMGECTPLTSSP